MAHTVRAETSWSRGVAVHRGAAALLCVLSAGCVEARRGANLQISFSEAVKPPPPEGAPGVADRAPPGTFFTLYAVSVAGAAEAPRSYALGLLDFEIKPAIDTRSPCFIETDESDHPGLHITMLAERLRRDTGIADPRQPAPGTDRGQVIDLLTAEQRMSYLPLLQATVKAVTSFSPARYGPVDDDCTDDGDGRLPPPACIDDAANERRLALCRDFWTEHPEFYEGHDLVFTLPLSGTWYGAVTGQNPINSGFIGGVEFFVNTPLRAFDALLINHRFRDTDGDGAPDYPTDWPSSQRSAIGGHYLGGTPERRARGVIHVPMRHLLFPDIAADAVIFPDLSADTVSF